MIGSSTCDYRRLGKKIGWASPVLMVCSANDIWPRLSSNRSGINRTEDWKRCISVVDRSALKWDLHSPGIGATLDAWCLRYSRTLCTFREVPTTEWTELPASRISYNPSF